MQIKQVPAARSNFTPSRAIYKPRAIVVHLMDGTLEGTDAWFQNAASRVSAHYGIGTTGEIHQYVQEPCSAYHCGAVHNPTWPSLIKGINPNFYTIGVEHEGYAGSVFTPLQLEASTELVASICNKWSITPSPFTIIGHHEIYDGHDCPGPGWNKQTYIQGVLDWQKNPLKSTIE